MAVEPPQETGEGGNKTLAIARGAKIAHTVSIETIKYR
jgi:hypothetical protein